jgi:hypothetical protein
MSLADKSKRFIDYGWNPVFSRDQTKILYSHQTKPITGYRALGTTPAGNEIRLCPSGPEVYDDDGRRSLAAGNGAETRMQTL